jgi:hypothetical protein
LVVIEFLPPHLAGISFGGYALRFRASMKEDVCIGVVESLCRRQMHAGLQRVEMDIGDDRRDWLLTREWTGLAK